MSCSTSSSSRPIDPETGEIVTRRNLPHWYVPGFMHFVTYRLAATIPAPIHAAWRRERELKLKSPPPPGVSPEEHRDRILKQFFARYDRYLDTAHPDDRSLVAEPVAEMIRENLHFHAGTLYELQAWCIMPNHVHVVLRPRTGSVLAGKVGGQPQLFAVTDYLSDDIPDGKSPLARVMHSLKSYTANRANELLGRSGQFWQHESYDHWVRNEDELERIIAYIHADPVKAGLARSVHEWKWSSAYGEILS